MAYFPAGTRRAGQRRRGSHGGQHPERHRARDRLRRPAGRHPVTVTDGSSNTGSSSLTTAGGIFVPTDEFLTFASFTGTVDFSDVEQIELLVEGLFPATDLQIGFIESAFVPEPGTALLLGLGLAGLAVRGRRR
jgi:hypothetical protein